MFLLITCLASLGASLSSVLFCQDKPSEIGQVALIHSPGLHDPSGQLARRMVPGIFRIA